jgi:co-chaperonin GroES (HSP10)
MKAINNYVVVDKIKTEQKKVAGLIMTEDLDQDNRYIKAKVISAGNLVEVVKDGDVVHYDKHAGYGIQYKDKLYFVIKVSDIVLVD